MRDGRNYRLPFGVVVSCQIQEYSVPGRRATREGLFARRCHYFFQQIDVLLGSKTKFLAHSLSLRVLGSHTETNFARRRRYRKPKTKIAKNKITPSASQSIVPRGLQNKNYNQEFITKMNSCYNINTSTLCELLPSWCKVQRQIPTSYHNVQKAFSTSKTLPDERTCTYYVAT